MKTVTFVRHGKSSWKESALADIARPLNGRGKVNAPKMGGRLLDMGVAFERIYASPANRALSTAQLLSEVMGYLVDEITVVDDLYTFSHAGILAWLQGLDESANNFAVVGHNPAITELVNYLSLSDIANIPTCGVAQLEMDIDQWCELDVGCADLVFFITPKQLDEV